LKFKSLHKIKNGAVEEPSFSTADYNILNV